MTLGRRDYVVGPGQSLWDDAGSTRTDVHLLAGFKQTLGAYSLIRCISDGGTNVHTHAYDDESTYLLEGELTVMVGDKRYDLEPGGFVYMPRLVPHQFIPHGMITCLNIQTPGGVMDAIIEDMDEVIASGRELDLATLERLQAKHGIDAPDGWFAG